MPTFCSLRMQGGHSIGRGSSAVKILNTLTFRVTRTLLGAFHYMERIKTFPGVLLALETATRSGSIAVLREGTIVVSKSGSAEQSHGERLPIDIIELLATLDLTVKDVERYAVAVGPGSFTGLRVGISTIQGLSLVQSVPIVGVSTLASLAEGVHDAELVGAWLDGQRHQVFSAGYLRLKESKSSTSNRAMNGGLSKIITVPHGFSEIEPHSVGTPGEMSSCWQKRIEKTALTLVGDGAERYESEVKHCLGSTVRVLPIQGNLAESVGRLAIRASDYQLSAPHALRPLYVRRPDVELTRDLVHSSEGKTIGS